MTTSTSALVPTRFLAQPLALLLAVAAWKTTSDLLSTPFDVARLHYSFAVRLGVARRSKLDGRVVEQALGTLERLSLGIFARRR